MRHILHADEQALVQSRTSDPAAAHKRVTAQPPETLVSLKAHRGVTCWPCGAEPRAPTSIRSERLMHVGSHPQDGSTLDADALPAIIDGLQDEGYSFVTLDALLG